MIEQLDVDPCSCDRSMGKGYEARELLPARAAGTDVHLGSNSHV
jgi:hypothetical protein